jgi:hypothetical protein
MAGCVDVWTGVDTMAEKGNGSKAVATVDKRPLGMFERLEQEMNDMRRQMFGLFPRPFFGISRPASLSIPVTG